MAGDSEVVRVAIVTESFLPSLNGVTTSVCRVLERLRDLGHEAVVVAPSPAPAQYAGFAVHQISSIAVRQFNVGLPTADVEAVLRRFRPDVVHVASPFVLGAKALKAAHRLRLPSVAIYQTDMPSYIAQHGSFAGRIPAQAAASAAWRWVRNIHSLATTTLAPSSSALKDLEQAGVPRSTLWGRGVDTGLFRPDWREDAATRALRAGLRPGGEVLVGYVGRIAPEKDLHQLVDLVGLPGCRLVVVGDGPSRPLLEQQLTDRSRELDLAREVRPAFLGRREGADLARSYAALDVFVHTGTKETFGQTLQEAAASALPVVAPAVGGPLDIVDHGTTGLLYDPERRGALTACVGSLVSDEPTRLAMGEAGLARVRERGWDAVVDQLVGHYTDAIEVHSTSGALA